MNSCFFIGRLKEPVRTEKENGVDVVYFTLEIEEYRKNKNGQKTRTLQILHFEAWHTAAITINQKLTMDDLISVECSARSETIPDVGDACYFRVNNFKIFKRDKFKPEEN